MEGRQSNQDESSLWGFTDVITGGMFASYGEMELRSTGSSLQAVQVPVTARRPSQRQAALYDMATVESNPLGTYLGNGNLLDDRSLSSALSNMSLSFSDGGCDTPVNSDIVQYRNAHYPPDTVVSSTDRTMNVFHQLAASQNGNDFMPSTMEITGLQRMEAMSHGRSAEWCYPGTTTVDQLGNGSGGTYLNCANELNSTLLSDFPCGSCEYCQTKQAEKVEHQYGRRCPSNSKGFIHHHNLHKVNTGNSAKSALMKPEGFNSVGNIKSAFAINGCIETNQRIDGYENNHYLDMQRNDTLHFDWQNSHSLSSLEFEYDLIRTELKYSSVDEVVETIYLLAKDQNGCRFLQRIFTEGAPEDVKKVFDGIMIHISELMVHPYGNYVVQKLLEGCNNDQKKHIIYRIAKVPHHLIRVSCDMHGTRVVQKVMETINTTDEVSMIVSALRPGAITLMKDANGSHVVQCCLQKLAPEYKAFILSAAIGSYFELAQDRHGCSIIQKCIDHANEEQKNLLLFNITSSALDLSEHQYGNYVIQYIIELKIMWATDKILNNLKGYYGYLSLQKCGSNVVEKCLKEAEQPQRVKIIHELINDPSLQNILVDQYGNYVIQTALRECQDVEICDSLVEAIRPYASALRHNKFGKRILAKTSSKNRKHYWG